MLKCYPFDFIFGMKRLFGLTTLHSSFRLLTYGFGPDVDSSQMNMSFRLQLKTFHDDSGVIATHPGFLTSAGCPLAHARKSKHFKGSLFDVKNSPRVISLRPT